MRGKERRDERRNERRNEMRKMRKGGEETSAWNMKTPVSFFSRRALRARRMSSGVQWGKSSIPGGDEEEEEEKEEGMG